MPTQTYEEHIPVTGIVSFSDADAPGTLKDLVVAGAYGAKVDSVLAVNTGVADIDMYVSLNDGNTTKAVGTVTVTAGAGWGTGPAVDVLAAAFPATIPYVLLPATYKLIVGNVTTPATDTYLNVVAFGGQF